MIQVPARIIVSGGKYAKASLKCEISNGGINLGGGDLDPDECFFDQDGNLDGDQGCPDRFRFRSTLMVTAGRSGRSRSILTVQIDLDHPDRDLDGLKINHDQVQVTSSLVCRFPSVGKRTLCIVFVG